MRGDEFSNPMGCRHQFAVSSFLDQPQVLVYCAMSVRIYFDT